MLSSCVPLAAFVLLLVAVAPVPKVDPPPSNGKALLDRMRAGSYRQGTDWAPKLGWGDIPALLNRAGSTDLLKSYPTNPISSLYIPTCTEGVMAMWLVEGVRKGTGFPSLNPVLVPADGAVKATDPPEEVAARAYRTWWWKVKTMPPEKAREVEPLEGTGLRWR